MLVSCQLVINVWFPLFQLIHILELIFITNRFPITLFASILFQEGHAYVETSYKFLYTLYIVCWK